MNQASTSGRCTINTPSRTAQISYGSRDRLTARYPARLTRGEPGRVPLHRRGTSRTYERLEDLLRENGYKETKIFSPESDRIESSEHDPKDGRAGSMRAGVGAVVDFLTGLMPGSSKSEEQSSSSGGSTPMQSPPPSPSPAPIAGKRTDRKSVV